MTKQDERFDALLKQMVQGEAPSAQGKHSEREKPVKHKPVEKPE